MNLKRICEITIGIGLILLGIVMLATPGPGTLTIIMGIIFVSPYHGRRVIWWTTCAWKWVKAHWFQKILGYARVSKKSRKGFLRLKRYKIFKRISKKP